MAIKNIEQKYVSAIGKTVEDIKKIFPPFKGEMCHLVNDLTGQHFNHITVLYRTEDKIYPSGKHSTQWVCQCDCEHQSLFVEEARLLKTIWSCGCENKYISKATPEVKFCIGAKYGKLTVLKSNLELEKGHQMCLCQCECGKEIKVRVANLKSGNTSSCGCQTKETARKRQGNNLIGRNFGYWKVIGIDEQKSTNGTCWFCKCTLCNSEQLHSISTGTLLQGTSLSCGCHISSIKVHQMRDWLKEHNIEYQTEYKFSDLQGVNNGILRFDFAIFKNNQLQFLIEYNGRQHYYPNYSWGGEEGLRKQQANDKIKNDYCNDNNIELVTYPYTLTIEEIIKDLERRCL